MAQQHKEYSCFWTSRNIVRHPTETKHPLCLHIFLSLPLLFPSSSHFLLPHFLFPDSHPLFVHISLTHRAHSSLSAVLLLPFLFYFLSFTPLFMRNESIVSTIARGICEVRLPTYKSNSANRTRLPLKWHNTLMHMITPQPQIVHS